MNKLIRNEFKKLFKRPLMLVLIFTMIGYIIINNVLNNIEGIINEEEWIKEELSYYEEEMKMLDYTTVEDNEYYINTKTNYDLIKLKLNYKSDSWQYSFIDGDYTSVLRSTIYDINQNKYGFNKDAMKLKQAQEQYNIIKQRLDLGDWQSFIKEMLNDTNELITIYEEQLKNTKEKITIQEINNLIEYEKTEKQALEWRLEKQIPCNYNVFLSNQIDLYVNNAQEVIALRNKENKTTDEEKYYEEAVKQMNISKYYIENNINIDNETTGAWDLLVDLNSYCGMFILIFGIIIAGAIVSNEYQKGTIKLLLTRPFSRNKILLAKYIVSLLTMFMFIILFALLQFIIGGIFEGFDVYDIPVVKYDLSTNSIVVMSVFKYMILETLCMLPMYVFCVTLAFALSTVTMNSTVAIAVPILLHMLSEFINMFVEKVKVLKYFITANWNLSYYLFGEKGLADGLTFNLSLGLSAVYIVATLLIAIVVFKKRDIKNI